MSRKILDNFGLFPIRHKDRDYLYAPLAGVIAETDNVEIESLCSLLNRGEMPDELAALCGGQEPELPPMPDALPEITILVNQRCNFSCRYCYSANGRSSAELDEALFDSIVNWFVTPERLDKSQANHLSVTFSGGGDPMLSFGKVKKLIEKFEVRADFFGISVDFGLVCNGSLLEDKAIDFLVAHVDNIVISFEVLEDVHNAQRSHYSTVARTIRAFCDKGTEIGLRATITELNVDRMSEMVETLAREFPNCRSIAMEAVLSSALWKNREALHGFYARFVDNYFRTKRKGAKLGISVGNTVEMSGNGIKSRACPGKMSIAPDGTLTACSRVAAPGDSFFSDFTFGKVDKEGVRIDTVRYREIMDVRADNIAVCRSCFARYHCGGGCMLARLSYDNGQMEEYCNFTRAMLLNTLMYELD